MICSKCNCDNTPDSKFCTNCGAKLEQTVTAAEPTAAVGENVGIPSSNPPAQTYADTVVTAAPVSESPAEYTYGSANAVPPVQNAQSSDKSKCFEYIKSFFSSPLILTAIIAFGTSMISSLLATANAADLAFGSLGYDDYWFTLAENISTSISAFISLIPSTVLLIGFILIYSSAKNKAHPTVKDSGFAVLKVMSIISLVLICILFAFVLLMMILAVLLASFGANVSVDMFGTPYYYSTGYSNSIGAAVAVIIFTTIILGLLAAFMISYSALTVKTISTMKKTAETGIPSDKVSSFVAVIYIISGVIQIIVSIPTTIYTSLYMGLAFYSAASIINSLSSSIFCICIGAIILSYKSGMKELMNRK